MPNYVVRALHKSAAQEPCVFASEVFFCPSLAASIGVNVAVVALGLKKSTSAQILHKRLAAYRCSKCAMLSRLALVLGYTVGNTVKQDKMARVLSQLFRACTVPPLIQHAVLCGK